MSTPNSIESAKTALSQEILIGNHWARFREEFRLAFLRKFQGPLGRGKMSSNVKVPGTWTNSVREISKFRRHCYECLAKWLLSQKAREPKPSDPTSDFFFPATEEVYNKQLVRDLTLKCADHRHQDQKFQSDVETFVNNYNLGQRCQKMKNEVLVEITKQKSSGKLIVDGLQTKVSQPGENETHRVEGIRRDIMVQIAEGFETAVENTLVYSLKNLYIPQVGWEKLRASFNKFSPFPDDSPVSEQDQELIFSMRAATVVLRYEVNLMSGSLQLCADNTLKRHLAGSGYHVMDLCASPINAFMSTPQLFVLDNGASPEAPQPDQLRPNNFCSAFYDTDKYFGSLGSALQIDSHDLVEKMDSGVVELTGKQLVLTLDVPYDEDLCELLFIKLKKDIDSVEGNSAVCNRIVWLLVLPLWWNLNFTNTPKKIIGATDTEMGDIIARNSNYLKRGYQLPYTWPDVLCGTKWALFDSVFVSKQYTYYCSSTNKLLAGVTETEVVGMQNPAFDGPNISSHLQKFYDHQIRGISVDSSSDSKRKRDTSDVGDNEKQ